MRRNKFESYDAITEHREKANDSTKKAVESETDFSNIDNWKEWLLESYDKKKREGIIMDLHVHSMASDGAWTPSEVIREAKKKGVDVIALTDHDTIYGLNEAIEEGKKEGIGVIPGIEIDAVYHGQDAKVKNLELLGLGIDPDKIRPFTEKRGQDRLNLITEYLDQFNEYINSPDFENINKEREFKLDSSKLKDVSVKDIISWKNANSKDTSGNNYENPNPVLSKMDIVRYITEHFLVINPGSKAEKLYHKDKPAGDDFKEEYKKILKAKQNQKPTFYEAISTVKSAEGLAILAHPGLSKGYENGMIKEWKLPENQWYNPNAKDLTPFKFVSDLKEHGLDGVELYYYKGSDKKHAADQDNINRYFKGLAKKLNLMTTEGSDCHGLKGGGPFIGEFEPEKEKVKKE